jgi:hypothetical protein
VDHHYYKLRFDNKLYFVRKEEDGEVAARRIQIRVPQRQDG